MKGRRKEGKVGEETRDTAYPTHNFKHEDSFPRPLPPSFLPTSSKEKGGYGQHSTGRARFQGRTCTYCTYPLLSPPLLSSPQQPQYQTQANAAVATTNRWQNRQPTSQSIPTHVQYSTHCVENCSKHCKARNILCKKRKGAVYPVAFLFGSL